ncbi:hypothetical protein HGB39_27975 [Rhodococcus opacus]|nr:hypothetical protein [Rhodococcus opacus]CAG7632536.1 hypothetical protein E143388_07410 [Rhodococcus opacus]
MSTLVLPHELCTAARTFFEDCGTRGHEGTAMIKHSPYGAELVIPEQQPWRGHRGEVSVEVTRRGQMQLAQALGADELYVARIHSHPAEAYHSQTDDANPVLTHEGALSIVVPFFGLGLRLGLNACAVLRREGGRWRSLPVGADRDRWIQASPGENDAH